MQGRHSRQRAFELCRANWAESKHYFASLIGSEKTPERLAAARRRHAINGDGDYLDTNLSAADIDAAVLRIVVTWQGALGPRTLEYSTIIAKGEVQ